MNRPHAARPHARSGGRTLVVGLGNPLLGDDAVGWRVAEAVRERLDGRAGPAGLAGPAGRAGPAIRPTPGLATADVEVEVDCLSLGGLRLMERLVGYERAIVVDAIVRGREPGSVEWSALDESAGPAPAHAGSAHDTSLVTALRLGRDLGADLPGEVLVLGIEAGPCFEFGERLSPPVARAVPRAAEMLLERLGRGRVRPGTALDRAGEAAGERSGSEHVPAPNNGSIGTGSGGPGTSSMH